MTSLLVRPTIAVAVCTYNRNEALTTLLEALITCASHLGERGAVGVVVVDDSADAKARRVVEQFEGRFELGIVYRISGRQNISLARNLAIEAAGELADWTAMTDDDCEPVPEWLVALLETQRTTGEFDGGESCCAQDCHRCCTVRESLRKIGRSDHRNIGSSETGGQK